MKRLYTIYVSQKWKFYEKLINQQALGVVFVTAFEMMGQKQ